MTFKTCPLVRIGPKYVTISEDRFNMFRVPLDHASDSKTEEN